MPNCNKAHELTGCTGFFFKYREHDFVCGGLQKIAIIASIQKACIYSIRMSQ